MADPWAEGNGIPTNDSEALTVRRPATNVAVRWHFLVLLAGLTAPVVAPPARSQTIYTWNNPNGGASWGTAVNWNPAVVPNDLRLATARFDTVGAGAASLATLGSSSFSVAGLQLNQNNLSPWTIGNASDTGVLTLGSGGIVLDSASTGVATIAYKLAVDQSQTWDTAAGGSIALMSSLGGSATITKIGAGTLYLDGPADSFVGGFVVSAGTLQAGLSSNPVFSASQALRSSAVSLASGTTLTTGGGTSNLRVGQLSGSGTVALASNGSVTVTALADATFSGSIATTGGLTLQGANGTTQTLSGNATALTGTIAVHSGATLKLSGTGDTTSGVIGGSTIAVRGGTVTLDNGGGNTAAAAGRVSDTAAVTFLGGTLSLVGNSSGTSETVGTLTLNSGAATISVANNGGTGAVLAFPNTSSLRASTSMTVNFVGNGGTLGSTGGNPRITFTGPIPTNTTNGMLANTSGASVQTIGWAVVNGTSWAGIGVNGIVALTDTARDSSNLSSAASWEKTSFSPAAATTTLSASLGTSATTSLGALKIGPTAAGQSLAIGTNNIFAPALMLVGPTDFTITGTTGGLQIGSGTRYVWVTDAAATLNYGAAFPSTGPLNKSGDGVLNLNGSTTQLPAANVNVLAGVLRGTTTTLGGSSAAGGASTTINLRGGVLEIRGGGSITRFLGAGAAGGGGIRWHSGSIDMGDGGFSAIGGDATVTLVTTAGGSTAATPTWNSTSFIQNGFALIMGSTKADSRIDLTNNIGLDDGASTNAYNAREVRVVDNPNSTTDVARLSGVVSGSATADLVKTGSGTLELTGANTYAGNTIVKAGTLALAATNTAPSSGTILISGGALDVGSFNQNLNAVILASGSITGTTGVINGTSYVVQSGSVSAILGGSGVSLTKTTTGTVTLSAANTYTGGTIVSAGTLRVSNPTLTDSATGTAAVDVNGSTAVLAGTGSVGGAVTIRGGGTLAPGSANAVGTLTVNNAVTFGESAGSGSTGTFQVRISPDGTASDVLALTGPGNSLAFVTSGANNATAVFVDFGLVTANFDPFLTYQYTIATTGNSTNPILVNGSAVADNSSMPVTVMSNYASPATFSLSRSGGNLRLDFTPVPEPAWVVAVLAAGLGSLGWWRRRYYCEPRIQS